MKRSLLKAILFIGIFTFLGVSSTKAQTNLVGKYRNIETVADEGLAAKNKDKINWLLEVKGNKTAVLTSIEGKTREIRQGTWSLDKESLTVNFPARKKGQMRFTYLFNVLGKNLVLAKMLTDEGEGETYGERIFKKL